MLRRDRDGGGAKPGLTIKTKREELAADLCVIGAGSGGLSVAAAAAAFGQRVVLIEKHKMGGDCLNYGCVPSKALIAAAKRAQLMRTSKPFGIEPVVPQVDHAGVRDHVRGVIAAIAPNDSIERFTGLGVRVILATGRFLDEKTVAAGDYRITARRFVIATGSFPLVPPIPGLDQIPYFTNETIFDNSSKLDHLIVIGAGPSGLELAQAHLRLGSRVTVVEAKRAMGKDEPELAAALLKALRNEGLVIREDTLVDRVEGSPGALRVTLTAHGRSEGVEGTHILVAAGRRPNLSELDLQAAGIEYEKQGIRVDAGLVTTNRRVFAIGDCTGGAQFTHLASYHSGIVIRRALFRLPATVNNALVPRVTYTEPELAHVGLTEAQAKTGTRAIRVLRWPYHENDRAQTERATEGFVKVVTDGRGLILGASIVGAHAGELIQPWSLAMSRKLKIRAMMDWISPYPTFSEINKRAALRYYVKAGSNRIVRKVIGLLAKLG